MDTLANGASGTLRLFGRSVYFAEPKPDGVNEGVGIAKRC